MDHEELAQHAAAAVRDVLAQAEHRAAEVVAAAEERAAEIVAAAEGVVPSPDPQPDPPREPEPDPVPEPEGEPDPVPVEAPAANSGPDEGGATLIAMKMAVDGADRDQIIARLDPALGEAARARIADFVIDRARN